jgi:hypothetical protein
MNLEPEISRLLDLMPASGRMFAKIVSKPQQSQVIEHPFPMPWKLDSRPIYINFDLWCKLPKAQRDLVILRAVSSVTGIKWFKPDWYQALTLAGLLGLIVEIAQSDAVGMVAAGGLTMIAAMQIWRNNRSLERELEADAAAIRIAQRRGYSEGEAARHLLSAIETITMLERRGLSFSELIRSQKLKAIV